jgi:hypothetical protein
VKHPEQRADVRCPHCGGELELFVTKPTTALEEWRANLHAEDREILELGETLKIVPAFATAYQEANPRQYTLANPGKQFLAFLHTASPLQMQSAPAIRMAIQAQFPEASDISVLRSLNVSALVLDGALTWFVPSNTLKAPRVEPSNGHLKVKELTEPMQRLENWIRTRNGYVPAESRIFLEELRRRTPGHFAKLGSL